MKLKKHIPNILSSLRLVSPMVLIPLILSGNYVTVGILLVFFFGTDALDGFLARKWHVESELGAKIDAVADKLMLGSFLIPLVIINPIISINLIFEALISLTNVIRKVKGGKPKTVQIGRIKMISICCLIILSYLNNVLNIPLICTNLLFTVTTILQVGTLHKYVKEAKKEFMNHSSEVENKQLDIDNCNQEELDLRNDVTNDKLNDLNNKKEELLRIKEELLTFTNNNDQISNDCEKVKIKKLNY